MSEKNFDWSYFKRRFYIKSCTKEELFNYWATAKGITIWFIESAEYKDENGYIRKSNERIKKNDFYSWIFHNGSKVEGKILEVKENELIKFTFGKQDPESEIDIHVTVTFPEIEGILYTEILHENIALSNLGRIKDYISSNSRKWRPVAVFE